MNIELINKENNLSITMDSFIGDTGVLVTLFEDEQIQGEFNKFKGVNQSGMSISSTTLSERTINVEGFILANSRDQIMEMRRQLIRVLNPKDDVLLKYKEDNINRAITIRAESIPIFSSDYKTNNDNALAFKCFLNAPYPFWQEIEGKKAEIVMWKGDFHFPLVIPKNKGIIMGHREPSLIVNVINNGDVETGMTIEFFARGTLKNPSLFNVNTREFIKVNKTMAPGEKIIINTKYSKKKIESNLNGITTNVLNYLDIIGGGDTFLQLAVGDNLFRYNSDENLDNLEVSIYFNEQYLGV